MKSKQLWIATTAVAGLWLIAGALFGQMQRNTAVDNSRRSVQSSRNVIALGQLSKEAQIEAIQAWNKRLLDNTAVVGKADPLRATTYSTNTAVELVEFEVVHVPGEDTVDQLYGYKVLVWRDATGSLFRTTITSRDPKLQEWTVDSVGPAIDRSSKERQALSIWPPKRRGLPSGEWTTDGRLIVLTYPNDAEKLFWQFGTERRTAEFENVETGHVVRGWRALVAELEREGR